MLHAISPIKIAIVTGLLLLAALLLVARPSQDPELRQITPPRVSVADVETKALRPVERLSGRLQPARKAALSFEVAGRINLRHVEPGQRVEADTALLALDAGDYQDSLTEAEARLALEAAGVHRDKRLLELAVRTRRLQQQEVKRVEDLGRRSLASESKLDEARRSHAQSASEEARLRYSVETADNRLSQRRATMERAQRDLQRTELRAPFAALVNTITVDVGEYVAPNREVLELVDITELDFYAELRGRVARGLSLGQAVTVIVDNVEHEGRVVALQEDPDPATFTHAVRIRIPGGAVWAGELAQAVLPLPALNGVLAVPVTAILREGGGAFVYQVNKDRLARTPVEPGPRIDSWQVIRGGLEAGATIVIRDVAALSDGQTVVPSRE